MIVRSWSIREAAAKGFGVLRRQPQLLFGWAALSLISTLVQGASYRFITLPLYDLAERLPDSPVLGRQIESYALN
ncbi:MAG TPA: hypothetical protein VFN88_14430, partial [Caulobacteraceae bacterium]|nr:hypothetical protein [Caulobacteraceae bacterium]